MIKRRKEKPHNKNKLLLQLDVFAMKRVCMLFLVEPNTIGNHACGCLLFSTCSSHELCTKENLSTFFFFFLSSLITHWKKCISAPHRLKKDFGVWLGNSSDFILSEKINTFWKCPFGFYPKVENIWGNWKVKHKFSENHLCSFTLIVLYF